MAPPRSKASLQKQKELPRKGDVQLRNALRKKYAEIQNEPIPERLQTLIETIRNAERARENKD